MNWNKGHKRSNNSAKKRKIFSIIKVHRAYTDVNTVGNKLGFNLATKFKRNSTV